MTCGIYLLGFKGTPKVYIGQSLHIEDRYADHCSFLKKNKHSVKMNAAYKEFGFPELEILEEGSYTEKELNELENYHIKLWNAVDDGFNKLHYAEDMPNKCGEDNGHSKYTNEQIKKVFFLLIEKQEMLFKEIAEITDVSVDVVSGVSKLSAHLWLKKEYPVEYTILENLVGTRNSHFGRHKSAKAQGIIYPLIMDPAGNIYNVENTCQFARDHGLDQSHLWEILRGKGRTYRGWKLTTTQIIVRPLVIYPLGNIYNIKDASQFAKDHKLDNSSLYKLLNSKLKTVQGWRLATQKEIDEQQ